MCSHTDYSSYNVTQFPVLCPALVVQAKLESFLCHVRVHFEICRVILEQL